MMPQAPLAGVKVLELEGVGPTPFAGMMLSDLGAEVVRVERTRAPEVVLGRSDDDILLRGRRSVTLDLKAELGRETFLAMVKTADVVLEGFRPGVCERLGIGPVECQEINPALIFARMTGWGQEGPLASEVGHDVNYLGVAGGLYPIGPAHLPPPPPLNYVGDFGGGGMLVALGIITALFERSRSGLGQTIDAAMVDGIGLQMAQMQGLLQSGVWDERRESNRLDGGAPFYRCYEASDGSYLAVSALEPHFYEKLLHAVGLDADDWPQSDTDKWPALRSHMEDFFKTRPREHWSTMFEGSDACVHPVLTPVEARTHPHIVARQGYLAVGDMSHPAPAPRFSRTPAQIMGAPASRGAHTREVLLEYGLTEARVQGLIEAGVTTQLTSVPDVARPQREEGLT